MRKSLYTLTVLAFAFGGSTACATKGFVKNEVSQVSSKVDTLSQSLEETQQRTKQNEAKINDVDGKAGAAQGAADHAQSSANEADSKAVAANDAAKAASAKADEVDKNSKRLVYTVVLSEDEGGFKFNKVELPDDAKAKIDQLVSQIKADPKGAYFEIEGHTDNTGDKAINQRLGQERADAVKMYLYETHQIPLHRMNVVSYGESKPMAPNNTKAGRAQNRRVVIRVLV
jgi:peptidoglycan-associated lipoprotein